MSLSVSSVHPEELRPEQRRLLAAGAGPDLHDDVAVVVGVGGQQRHADALHDLGLLGLELAHDLAGHLAELRVVLRFALQARGLELGADGSQAPVVIDDRGEACLLPPQLAAAIGIRRHLGVGPLLFDMRQAALDVIEALLEAHDPVPSDPAAAAAGRTWSSADLSPAVSTVELASSAWRASTSLASAVAWGMGSRSGT